MTRPAVLIIGGRITGLRSLLEALRAERYEVISTPPIPEWAALKKQRRVAQWKNENKKCCANKFRVA